VNVQNPVIEVSDLCKTYDSGHRALDNIQLNIERGEIFALLGPNGAGKTTLIGSICGLVNFSEGKILADGFDVHKDYRQARSRIGLVPQELCTESFETVLATVNFSRGLFGKAPDAAHIEGLLKDLSLWDKRDARILELSGGMKRRVMIAKALSHEPSILFLDEPTTGLDPQSRRHFWSLIRTIKARGKTVLLTTHYMEEAELLCDQLIIMDKGNIIAEGSPQSLLRQHFKDSYICLNREDLDDDLASLGSRVEVREDGIAIATSNVEKTLAELVALNINLRSLRVRNPSLDDLFLKLTGHHLRE